MKRYARLVLAVVFVALLATPFLIRRFGRAGRRDRRAPGTRRALRSTASA